jgi:hypothetical protein
MPVLRFIEPCLPSPADRPPSGTKGEVPSVSGRATCAAVNLPPLGHSARSIWTISPIFG